jgi:two-component system, OmpR family, heavy metal sensor histidine kinase CusS
MKSIRLSLLVYFLGLLALALGAASLLAFRTTHQTLLAKKQATAEVIRAQYQERCRKEEEKFNSGLLDQAQLLARLIEFETSGMRRWREIGREVNAVEAVTSPLGPWAMMWVQHQPLFPPKNPNAGDPNQSEIKDGEMLVQQVDNQVAEYFQIDSPWTGTLRSPSLVQPDLSLPLDPAALHARGPNPKPDDVTLSPDLTVRRVLLKAPMSRPWFWQPPRPTRPGGKSPPDPGKGDPPQPKLEPTRAVVVIQCARNLADHRATLAGFAEVRDRGLAELDSATEESLASLKQWLLAVAVATFAATAVGGLVLVRVGLAPLGRLGEAVSQVSEKDFRLPLGKAPLPVELRPIAGRLTQTLDQLRRAFEREKQAAADISHELRTPLAALLTTTEVALKKPRSVEEYREVIQDCRASGQQMSRLVERLLMLARLDAGVDRIRARAVDVAGLAEECAALVRPLAAAREVSVRVHHDGPAEASADPDKLREVLTNLLHNAIQYNKPRGSIDVTVARSNGHLAMEVRDTGIGIAPEARAHVFERFYRADPSRQNDGMNAGLGLAIVKGYVELMGGTIAVESAVGEGSTFRVQLPALAPSPKRGGGERQPAGAHPAAGRSSPLAPLPLRGGVGGGVTESSVGKGTA